MLSREKINPLYVVPEGICWLVVVKKKNPLCLEGVCGGEVPMWESRHMGSVDI